MNDNEERMELIREFMSTYRKLQKRVTLKMRSHFDSYGDNYIEIWECNNGKIVRNICRAREDEETACYKRAIGDLKRYAGYREIENE